MIEMMRNKIIKYSTNTTQPPTNPHSSERMLKIKSVLCWGKNRRWLWIPCKNPCPSILPEPMGTHRCRRMGSLDKRTLHMWWDRPQKNASWLHWRYCRKRLLPLYGRLLRQQSGDRYQVRANRKRNRSSRRWFLNTWITITRCSKSNLVQQI